MRPQTHRKVQDGVKTGIHLLERGVQLAHTLHGAYKVGSAIASTVAPLMAAAALYNIDIGKAHVSSVFILS